MSSNIALQQFIKINHEQQWVCTQKRQQVTYRGPKHKHSFVCRYVAPPGECYYNTLIMLRLFLIVECGISHFLCAMHVFEVQASSSSPRLALCLVASIAELAQGEKSLT